MRCRLLLSVVIAAHGSLDQYVTYGRAGTPLGGVDGEPCTGAGFNNRLQALQMALIVAVSTNRTLLVHDFTLGHNTGPDVPYSRFFDIDWPTRRVADMPDLPTTDLPFGPYGCLASVPGLVPGVAVSDAKVLRYPACYGWWTAVLRPTLPKQYRAMHFRLGDRPGLALDCAKGPVRVRHWEHPKQPTSEETARTWGWDGCPLVEMEDAFDQWAATGPVYISTNRPADPRVVALAKRTTALRWQDLPFHARHQALTLVGFTGPANGAAVSLLEQMICADADAYLPAWPSSWETLVLYGRLYLQKSDAAEQLAFVRTSLLRRNHMLAPEQCAAPPVAPAVAPPVVALPAVGEARRAKSLLRRR